MGAIPLGTPPSSSQGSGPTVTVPSSLPTDPTVLVDVIGVSGSSSQSTQTAVLTSHASTHTSTGADSVDHNTLTNTHNLTTAIDHDTITNTHNLTTAIDHDTITNNHNLTTDIDHDALTNFVATEHVEHTSITLTLTQTADETSISSSGTPLDIGTSRSWTIGIADDVILPGTGSMYIPHGTTAEEPVGPDPGMMRYNDQTGLFRGAWLGTWQSFTYSGGAFHDTFSDFVADEHIAHTGVTLTLTQTTDETSVTNTGSALDITASRSWTIGIADDAVMPGSGSMTVPVGDSAAEPVGPNQGEFRYNSQTGRFRGSWAGTWYNLVYATGVPLDNQIPIFTSDAQLEGETGLTFDGSTLDTDGTLTVDTINEHTGANGVTIEGVSLKDSDVVMSTGNYLMLTSNGSTHIYDNAGTMTFLDGATGPVTLATLAAAGNDWGTATSTYVVLGSSGGSGEVESSTAIEWTAGTNSLSFTGGAADGAAIALGYNSTAVVTINAFTATQGRLTFPDSFLIYPNNNDSYIGIGSTGATSAFLTIKPVDAATPATYVMRVRNSDDSAYWDFLEDGSMAITLLGSDDTEDHVMAIDDATGVITKRSVTSITDAVPTFVGTATPGLVPGSGGSSTTFLNGAGSWSVPLSTGSDNEIPVMSGTTDFGYDSNFTYDGTYFLIGSSGSPQVYFSDTASFSMYSIREADSARFVLGTYSNTASDTNFHQYYRYGGTISANLVAPSSAVIKAESYTLYDGAVNRAAGAFGIEVDGAVASDDFDTKFTWDLKDGASASAEVMALYSNGDLQIQGQLEFGDTSNYIQQLPANNLVIVANSSTIFQMTSVLVLATADIRPSADTTYDLGGVAATWANIYAANMQARQGVASVGDTLSMAGGAGASGNYEGGLLTLTGGAGTGTEDGGKILIQGGVAGGTGDNGLLYLGDGAAVITPEEVYRGNFGYLTRPLSIDTTTGLVSYSNLTKIATAFSIVFGDDGVQKTIVTFPAGAVVWRADVYVVTGFNGGGTDLVRVGTSTDTTKFFNDVDVSGAGWLTTSAAVPFYTGAESVLARYDDSANNAAAGELIVYVEYSIN